MTELTPSFSKTVQQLSPESFPVTSSNLVSKTIILTAVPELPNYPELTHVCNPKVCQLSSTVDEKKNSSSMSHLLYFWLLLSKILQTRECAQYYVIQTKYGIETDTLPSPAYGLPVQISCFAGCISWCASDMIEDHHFSCCSWRGFSQLPKANAYVMVNFNVGHNLMIDIMCVRFNISVLDISNRWNVC